MAGIRPPSLAPRNLVSNANVQVISAVRQPMNDLAGSLIRLGRTLPLRLAMALTGYRPHSRDGQRDPRPDAPAIRALSGVRSRAGGMRFCR
jgi:hypothetical protein